MYTRKDVFNSRGYAIQLKTASNALKTIYKTKQHADYSIKTHGDPYIERADIEYIFFGIQELRMICFDYAFSALENFLEHIGFILFDDWDSKNKQRHYIDKQEKLLMFSKIIEKKHQPNLDYATLEIEWNTIIQSINPNNFNCKRNPIKHIHSEKHDVKMQVVSTDSTMMNHDEYEMLINGTFLDLTDDECIEITKKVETFINLVHSYIQEHKLIFRIYCDWEKNQKVEKRKKLLEIFLVNPLAPTIYSSGLTVTT